MQSNLSLSRIHETSLAYNQSVRQFKRECLNAGLVGSPKSSIEDCIGGLRAALQELSLELMVRFEKWRRFKTESYKSGLFFSEELIHSYCVVSSTTKFGNCSFKIYKS